MRLLASVVGLSLLFYVRTAHAAEPAPPEVAPTPHREARFEAGGESAALDARVQIAGSWKWLHVCDAPCNPRFTTGVEYSAIAPGAPRSQSFFIRVGAEPTSVHVSPGSRAAKITGIVLVPVGGMSLLLGIGGAMTSGTTDSYGRAALAVGLGGAALITTGILLLTAGRTKVAIASP